MASSRGPQSAQSLHGKHVPYAEPAPPSSQSASPAKLHALSQIRLDGGGEGVTASTGAGGAYGAIASCGGGEAADGGDVATMAGGGDASSAGGSAAGAQWQTFGVAVPPPLVAAQF